VNWIGLVLKTKPDDGEAKPGFIKQTMMKFVIVIITSVGLARLACHHASKI